MATFSVQLLPAQEITPKAFAPYGQVIAAIADDQPFSSTDAQLDLHQGTPRFYIMRLYDRGRQFTQITRHQRCTQCLGSLGGKPWLLAVAPPTTSAQPQPDEIVAFRIPGDRFIKLNLGTWHSGPYFEEEWIDFYNLELSDTNTNDHETCNLQVCYGKQFEIS